MTKNFRDRLHTGEQLLGTWLKTPSSILCEVLGRSELDVVCIDAEHAPFDRVEQDRCIHALNSAGMDALVRVPAARPEYILSALDCGATGVVVPHVLSASQAGEMVEAAHFGAGGRGYAGSSRSAKYTGKGIAEHLTDSAARTTVVLQIEDLDAVECIDEIAAVDRVDCLFIGRIDLTVALGAQSPKSDEVVTTVERICAAGKAAGVPVGMFLGDLTELPYWQAAGANLFILSSDHGFLLQGAAQLVSDFRKAR
ncbi:MAG: aldolase/citrate lyase family protein [Pseudomonadota bacterium]